MSLGNSTVQQSEKYAVWLRESVFEEEWRMIREATQRGQLTGHNWFVEELSEKYGRRLCLVLEETAQGILLRKQQDDKLSWADTYKAMANEGEDWNEYNQTLLDGLEDVEDEDFDA